MSLTLRRCPPEERRRWMPLLLLADEQESMVERYLDRGELFLLWDGTRVRGLCVLTREGDGIYEVKNLAICPDSQCRGYGRALLDLLRAQVPDCRTLYVGTGDSPLTLPLYRACGFRESHRVRDFFLKHYDHPIWEGGRRLTDMVCLRWDRPETDGDNKGP